MTVKGSGCNYRPKKGSEILLSHSLLTEENTSEFSLTVEHDTCLYLHSPHSSIFTFNKANQMCAETRTRIWELHHLLLRDMRKSDFYCSVIRFNISTKITIICPILCPRIYLVRYHKALFSGTCQHHQMSGFRLIRTSLQHYSPSYV